MATCEPIYNPYEARVLHKSAPSDLEYASTNDDETETTAGAAEAARTRDDMDTRYCKLRQKYTEGSRWTAWEVNDIVAMEGAERVVVVAEGGRNHTSSTTTIDNKKDNIGWDMAVPLSFGCQTEMRGQFRKQYANGILGLEHSNYSIISVWHRQGLISQPGTFRLCLHPTGGWFSVGHGMGHDTVTMHPTTTLKYTPSSAAVASAATLLTTSRRRTTTAAAAGPPWDDTRSTTGGFDRRSSSTINPKLWYSVVVESVWLGDRLLADIQSETTEDIVRAFHQGKATILDSGTTDTFLPAALEPVLAPAWEEITGLQYHSQRRHEYTWLQFQALPDIHLQLAANVTWTLRPRFYMEGVSLVRATSNSDHGMQDHDDTETSGSDGLVVQPWSGKKTLTNRVYVDEPIGAVLGLNAMMGYEIEFNHPRQAIGVALTNCHP
ncbi:hypothetical protein ACA910_001631 [Epithemia clementina (nom. ined.)]